VVEKVNVSDFETVKNLIMEEWYDYLQNVNALQSIRMTPDSSEYESVLDKVRKNLTNIANLAWPSRNIDEETFKRIMYVKRQLGVDCDYESVCGVLDNLTTKMSNSLGNKGFLDTRLERRESVDIEEELPEEYKGNKMLERMLEGASKETN